MYSKKVILWPVIISVIGHAALISVSGMIDLRDNVKVIEIFTVDIKEPDLRQTPKAEEKKEVKSPAKESKEGKPPNNDGWREETVDLASSDIKYAPYLNKIKRKILQVWRYPQKAYDKNEEGVVVIRMSIDASGILAGTNLMSSSGSILLDENALSVIRAAAPFEPLPGSYSLSRLHIVASFNYNLAE
jgi:TonB family protein